MTYDKGDCDSVVFCHVAKTAGGSLFNSIKHNFVQKEAFELLQNNGKHLLSDWTHLQKDEVKYMAKDAINVLNDFHYIGEYLNLPEVIKIIYELCEIPKAPCLVENVIHNTPYKQNKTYLNKHGVCRRAKQQLEYDYAVYSKFIGRTNIFDKFSF